MIGGVCAGRLPHRILLAAAVIAGAAPAPARAQNVTLAPAENALRVRAPGFRFIHGEVLGRLKDGQSVGLELRLILLDGRGGSALAQARRLYDLSYDLWEERFAVALEGTRRGVTHMTQADAERWCLQQLEIPVTALPAPRRGEPFWIRLAYRILDGPQRAEDSGVTFTLRGLIDRLSRRSPAGQVEDSIEAGPFRLSD